MLLRSFPHLGTIAFAGEDTAGGQKTRHHPASKLCAASACVIRARRDRQNRRAGVRHHDRKRGAQGRRQGHERIAIRIAQAGPHRPGWMERGRSVAHHLKAPIPHHRLSGRDTQGPHATAGELPRFADNDDPPVQAHDPRATNRLRAFGRQHLTQAVKAVPTRQPVPATGADDSRGRNASCMGIASRS